MKSLSLVMLTHNEEEFLSDSLDSIMPWVDETIIIDQYSTDRTFQIAQSKGARVVLVAGNFLTHGEPYFRNLATKLCRTDWMMTTDADEVLTDNWAPIVRNFIDREGDSFGCIHLPFYHLMASYEFHAANSPLWRPAFVRRHPNLLACPPKDGTRVHSNYYLSYQPPAEKRLSDPAIFHLGYIQRDLMKRWETNIRRGDYGHRQEQMDAALEKIRPNPCSPFPECQPLDLPLSKYPSVLQGRVGRTYNVKYDPATRRILSRSVIQG